MSTNAGNAIHPLSQPTRLRRTTKSCVPMILRRSRIGIISFIRKPSQAMCTHVARGRLEKSVMRLSCPIVRKSWKTTAGFAKKTSCV